MTCRGRDMWTISNENSVGAPSHRLRRYSGWLRDPRRSARARAGVLRDCRLRAVSHALSYRERWASGGQL